MRHGACLGIHGVDGGGDLDLRHEQVKPDEQSQFDDMLRALHKRQKIVVIAGAGISVSAGSMSNSTSLL